VTTDVSLHATQQVSSRCDVQGIQTAQRTGERSDRSKNYRPRIGIAFVHTVIDDHSRMAGNSYAAMLQCRLLTCAARQTTAGAVLRPLVRPAHLSARRDLPRPS
jgi:hypothetical protein